MAVSGASLSDVIPAERHERVYTRLRRAMARVTESITIVSAYLNRLWLWIPGSLAALAPRNDNLGYELWPFLDAAALQLGSFDPSPHCRGR